MTDKCWVNSAVRSGCWWGKDASQHCSITVATRLLRPSAALRTTATTELAVAHREREDGRFTSEMV
jgi:hypothetical protein